MHLRGVNYDTGTAYQAGDDSRPVWTVEDVRRDLAAIRDDLGANSVSVYGTDLERIRATAALAIAAGLHVAVQLRSVDESRDAMLDKVGAAAAMAEGLRRDGAVTLNVGCEATLFTRGFIPGRTFGHRIHRLGWFWPFLWLANRRLNRHLARAVERARARFGGPITYSAGAWETVDWRPFDFVGVNLYRDRANERTYLADLRALGGHDRPVLITEFGCSTFEGAEREGGGGWAILDFTASRPAVKAGYVRSEETQARLIGDLLNLFAAEGVHGAYVFDFMQAAFPHHPDPAKDRDMAGYGLVKVHPLAPGATTITWERKKAFDAVARRYRAMAAADRGEG